MAGIGNISTAVNEPPATGRARVRGQFIRRVADDRERYECDWQGVWDRREKRVLDLSDPFASREIWQKVDDFAGDKYRLISDGMLDRIIALEGSQYFHY